MTGFNGRVVQGALVFIGGALGTGIRYGLGHFGESMVMTTVVNLTGALALGWLVGRFGAHDDGPALHIRMLFGTGLLGAYTTYSTLALALLVDVTMLDVALAAVSLIAGVLLAGLGLRTGQRHA